MTQGITDIDFWLATGWGPRAAEVVAFESTVASAVVHYGAWTGGCSAKVYR